MTPGSLAWRQAYARGLKALRTLQGGGTHQRGALFGAKDPWSDRLIIRLLEQGLMVEASADTYRAESGGKLGRVLAHEQNLCRLLGLGVPEYTSEAAVLASDASLLDSSRVVDKLVDIFGVELLQNRFDIASPRLRAMRAVARMPENVAVAFERAGMSTMHAIALTHAPPTEEMQLQLLDLARAHALSARELQSIATRVRNGISVERAALDAGLSDADEPHAAPAPPAAEPEPDDWPVGVIEYASRRNVSQQAIYAQLKRRRTDAPGEMVTLNDGGVAMHSMNAGRWDGRWVIYPDMQTAQIALNPPAHHVDNDEEFSATELAAAALKASMATLDIVSQMYRRVDFLARELGYKEDADATG